MQTLFNRTWELSRGYEKPAYKNGYAEKVIDQNIKFLVNKKANNRSNDSETEEKKEKKTF